MPHTHTHSGAHLAAPRGPLHDGGLGALVGEADGGENVAAAVDDDKVPEHLFVSGDRMSILDFAQTWEQVHDRKVTLERLGSLEDLEAETKRQLTEQPQNMFAWLPLMYARGVFGGAALLGDRHNARFPAIHPETVAQALARGAA